MVNKSTNGTNMKIDKKKEMEMKETLKEMKKLRECLKKFININSIDNFLNTPDYILTEFILNFLMQLKFMIGDRDKFYNNNRYLEEIEK